MAINNMAMILLAGGAAIIGVSFLVKSKDDEAPRPVIRTGLTVQQIRAAEAAEEREAEEREAERDAAPRRGGGGPVIGQVAAGPVIVAQTEPTFIRVSGV